VECVGYLLEELRNPETLEAFRADVGSADIFIGSLIFIQELAEKVRPISFHCTMGLVGMDPWHACSVCS
jgi:magnesium chelatase subunit H